MQKQNGCLTAFVVIIGIIGAVLLVSLAIGAFYAANYMHSHQAQIDEASSAESSEVAESLAPDVANAGDGAFVRDRNLRLGGRYEASSDARSGHLKLERISVGAPEYFDALEAGGAATVSQAPFVLEFGDVTSPAVTTDEGTSYAVSVRVACRRYSLTRDAFTCEGEGAGPGKVSFRGKLDPAFVAKITVSGGPKPYFLENALTGDLTVGGQTIKGVTFTYWDDE